MIRNSVTYTVNGHSNTTVLDRNRYLTRKGAERILNAQRAKQRARSRSSSSASRAWPTPETRVPRNLRGCVLPSLRVELNPETKENAMIRISVNPENIGSRSAEIGPGGREFNVVEHNWPTKQPKTGALVVTLNFDLERYEVRSEAGALLFYNSSEAECNRWARTHATR